MSSISEQIDSMLGSENVSRVIISKAAKTSEYRKIDIQAKNKTFQITKYTDKQAFHENVQGKELTSAISNIVFPKDDKVAFRQVNLWTDSFEHIFLISKSGDFTHKKRALKQICGTSKF